MGKLSYRRLGAEATQLKWDHGFKYHQIHTRSGVLNLWMVVYPQIRLKPYCVPPNQSINHLRTPKSEFKLKFVHFPCITQYHLNEIYNKWAYCKLIYTPSVDFLVRSRAKIGWFLVDLKSGVPPANCLRTPRGTCTPGWELLY